MKSNDLFCTTHPSSSSAAYSSDIAALLCGCREESDVSPCEHAHSCLASSPKPTFQIFVVQSDQTYTLRNNMDYCFQYPKQL